MPNDIWSWPPYNVIVNILLKVSIFPIIGKKNNQTWVSDADPKISTLGSTDIAGNSVNLVSGIIHLPSGLDFSVCIRDQCYVLSVSKRKNLLQLQEEFQQ